MSKFSKWLSGIVYGKSGNKDSISNKINKEEELILSMKRLFEDDNLIVEAQNGEQVILTDERIKSYYHINPKFQEFGLDQPEMATDEVSVYVYEYSSNKESISISKIFKSIPRVVFDLDRFVMTQSQILAFFEKHKACIEEGYSQPNMFLIKKQEKYLLVTMRVCGNGVFSHTIHINVLNLEDKIDLAWVYTKFKGRIFIPRK